MCVEHTLILPALEAFEERLQDPTTYLLFYHYFLRSAVGESEWKFLSGIEVKRKNRKSFSTQRLSSQAAPIDQRLASPLTEAFAMIMLRNNYSVWLLEAKEEFGSALRTDYDDDIELEDGESMMSLTEWIVMRHFIVDLENGEEENGFVFSIDEDTGNELKEAYIEMVKERRHRLNGCRKYQKIMESMTMIDADETEQECTRKTKRRKILRELKAYTGAREKDERKYKGWSKRGFQEMLSIKHDVIKEEEQYRKFVAAYRRIVAAIEGQQSQRNSVQEYPTVCQLDGLYDDIPTD